MKKVIFECTGNSILFILVGLMLIHPFSDYQNSVNEFYFKTGIFPAIFFFYLIIFIGMRFLIYKNGMKSLYKESELTFSDEREKIIVAESTKISYQVLVGGLLVTMTLLAGIRFFSLTFLQSMEINMYAASIGLVTLNLVFAMISYCVKWCVDYKK